MSDLVAEERTPEDILRPSAIHRAIGCTASAQACATVPNKESAYADEGNCAHHLLALMFIYDKSAKFWMNEEFFNTVIDLEMIQCIQEVHDHLMNLVNQMPGCTWYSEYDISMKGILPKRNGTADFVIVDWKNNKIYIFDLKYGKGFRVKALNNAQLKTYMAGVRKAFATLHDFDQFEAWILQPRIENNAVDEYTNKELDEFTDTVVATCADALDDDPIFTAGDHCKFCDFKDRCLEFGKHAMDSVGLNFEDLDAVPTIAEVGAFSPEYIGETALKLDGLRDFIGAVESRRNSLVNTDEGCPGWKQVLGGNKTRSWKDYTGVRDLCKKQRKHNLDAYEPRELLSPAQMEKLFTKKEFKARFSEVITYAEQKPVVVPATDERPEYSPALAMPDLDAEAIDPLS